MWITSIEGLLMIRSFSIWLITFALMSALAYVLKNQTPDFVEGAAFGVLGTLSLLCVCYKLGVRMF